MSKEVDENLLLGVAPNEKDGLDSISSSGMTNKQNVQTHG